MADNELDPVDFAAVLIGAFVAPMVYGVYTLDVEVFGLGAVLTDALVTIQGQPITLAAVISTLAVGWVLITNGWFNDSSYSFIEKLVVGVVVLAVPAYVASPVVAGIVGFHGAIKLMFSVGFAGGLTFISYIK